MTRHIALFLAATLTTAGAACSSPESTTSAPPPAAAASSAIPAPSAAPAPAVVHDGRPIRITANDQMKFDVTEITAKAGEKLSVTFGNTGTTPKFSMGHNWVLLAGGTDAGAFAMSSAEAATTDYVRKDAKEILAATKLLGPNESDTVTFTAPTAPGRYEFICTFPGHFQVGMRGVLIVS